MIFKKITSYMAKQRVQIIELFYENQCSAISENYNNSLLIF